VTRGDVATASSAKTVASRCSLNGPRAPFEVLAGMMLASAGLVAFFYLFPGTFEIARVVEVPIFVALLVLGAFTGLVAPRLQQWWWLDFSIVSAGVIAACAVALVPHGEGQLTIGIGLLALGGLAAYYRPTRVVVVDMVVCSAMFLLATVINPILSTHFLGIVYCVIIVGGSYAYSVLVTRLRDQALHDPLTGLLNRHALSLLAPPVVAGARRAHADVTVCLVDLDKFKAYNDSRGHLAGDALLVAAAEAWTSTARDSDLVVRWGGDEIVVVLIGTSPAAAQDLLDRAVAAFEAARPDGWQHSWTSGTAQLRLTETVDAAIGRADTELLTRKRGRLPEQRTD
jgi:diguanylate cyclase (GGDEF)-like protein